MSLFAPTGGRAAKFPQPGATITGKISATPFEKQATKFGSQDLDFWPNGDPRMDIVVPLEETNVPREDGNDDGDRTIYVSSKNMRNAIAGAIQTAGQQDVAIGGTLTVTYVGNDPNSKNPANPAKLYEAQYTPPATGLAQPSAQATAATPQQQAYVQPAAPAAPPAAPQPQPPAQQQPIQQPPAAPTPQQQAATSTPGSDAVLPIGVTAEQAEKVKQLQAVGSLDQTQIAAALGLTPDQVGHVLNGTF